jgi:replication fork clamp-binding protein CrfC
MMIDVKYNCVWRRKINPSLQTFSAQLKIKPQKAIRQMDKKDFLDSNDQNYKSCSRHERELEKQYENKQCGLSW